MQIHKTTHHPHHSIHTPPHYSQILPIQYKPTQSYIHLFYQSLKQTNQNLPEPLPVLPQHILKKPPFQTLLSTFATPPTPIRLLIKPYIPKTY
ncbi:cysteine protease StiP domain-containing protein, partial [Bacillus pumilus]|uniref:cysteine protease StiP domain-containing protein n=1 Tax=Bacillus pumilus TaxID=1408 RepID=UPI003703BA48